MVKFASTKTYDHNVGLTCCFRQWKAASHCKYLHGYALKVKLVFDGELDNRNWVVDFGALKPIKAWLEQVFDHKTLVAFDDPEYVAMQGLHKKNVIDMIGVDATGCEAFATMIYDYVDTWLVTHHAHGNRVSLQSVEVSEHAGNSAICSRGSDE